MSTLDSSPALTRAPGTSAMECSFPIVEISQVAERESWRKEVNRPLYHIHKWWATRLGSVFRGITLAALEHAGTDVWRDFYRCHRFSGKVVLDPFMGSGTTLGEAVKLGAKAIGSDINPISTFLVRQAFTRVPVTQLRAEFKRLEQRIAPEIRRYYETRDPASGERIPVLYVFWVKVLTAPDGEAIPLFSHYVFAKDAYPKRRPAAQILCPMCWGILEGRYDSTDIECPHCDGRFDPQVGPACGQYVRGTTGSRYRIKDLLPSDGWPPAHKMYALLALRPNGDKVYLRPTSLDEELYSEAEIRLQSEVLPLPTMAVRSGNNTDQARGYNYLRWRDFFNSRQLLCLGLLLRGILEIPDKVVQEQMLCLFSSTLEFNNLFCSFKGEGTGAVRHMFSNHILKPERTPLENSVWGTEKSSGTFSTLFESRLIPAKQYLDEPFEVDFEQDLFGERIRSKKTLASDPINVALADSWDELREARQGIMALNVDSSNLPLPDACVDAVITDPPYFDFVHYSELSDFFFAWLSPVLRDRYPWLARPDSSDQGEVQHKDPEVFAGQLAAVFSECRRVLKHDGVLIFTFHHSRPEGWAAIHRATAAAGLVVVAAYPVHAELRTASPKAATKNPISLDAIVVCRKAPGLSNANLTLSSIRERAEVLSDQLERAGMTLSLADRFVILASQSLIPLSTRSLDFGSACDVLNRLYLSVRSDIPAEGITLFT